MFPFPKKITKRLYLLIREFKCLATLLRKMYTVTKKYMIKECENNKTCERRPKESGWEKKNEEFVCVWGKRKLSENQLRWDNCMLIAYQLQTVK